MIFTRSSLVFTAASPFSALSQSSRHVFSAAHSTAQHTSRLHSTLSTRLFQANHTSFSASLPSSSSSSLRFSLLSKSHTTSSVQHRLGMSQQHQYRRFTSPSSSSSTASSTVASTAGILGQESVSTVASSSSKTATPLSFHEEMTKVRFSYNWWKEWTIIMVRRLNIIPGWHHPSLFLYLSLDSTSIHSRDPKKKDGYVCFAN